MHLFLNRATDVMGFGNTMTSSDAQKRDREYQGSYNSNLKYQSKYKPANQ